MTPPPPGPPPNSLLRPSKINNKWPCFSPKTMYQCLLESVHDHSLWVKKLIVILTLIIIMGETENVASAYQHLLSHNGSHGLHVVTMHQ
jgi:hypothetical protein